MLAVASLRMNALDFLSCESLPWMSLDKCFRKHINVFTIYKFRVFPSIKSAEICSVLFKGEYHGNNPEMSKLLHKAVRQKLESAYSVYQQHLANRPVNVSRQSDFLPFLLRHI